MMQTRPMATVLLVITLLAVFIATGATAEQPVPDSFIMKGQPGFYMAPPSPGYEYLRKHNCKITVGQIFPHGSNPYSMPEMVVLPGLKLDSGLMGEDLLSALINERKITRNGAYLTVEKKLLFFAVRFASEDAQFRIIGWLPDFLLPKFGKAAICQK